MTVCGIVAALPAELSPLVKRCGLRRQGQVFLGEIAAPGGPAVRVMAASAGMGAAAATHAFASVAAAAQSSGTPLDCIVSYGWAGAISCGVKPPEVYAPGEVIDARTGERFRADIPESETGVPLRLVTLDHIACADEKRPLAERYRAVLVDMEAAAVARLARAHGIRFRCIKGISDGYTDILPDFNRYLDDRQQLRLPLFAASALLKPRTWPALARLGRNSRAAAEALAAQVPEWLRSGGLVS